LNHSQLVAQVGAGSRRDGHSGKTGEAAEISYLRYDPAIYRSILLKSMSNMRIQGTNQPGTVYRRTNGRFDSCVAQANVATVIPM